ncbi:MAG: Nif11-like leader peptide family RiPP precursor [Pseudomonadota bacterium]
MSNEEIKRFQTEVKGKKNLQDELAAAGSDMDKIVSIANKNGYKFSKDELTKFAEEAKSRLSDDDLEKVAGGAGNATAVTVTGVVVTVCVGVI